MGTRLRGKNTAGMKCALVQWGFPDPTDNRIADSILVVRSIAVLVSLAGPVLLIQVSVDFFLTDDPHSTGLGVFAGFLSAFFAGGSLVGVAIVGGLCWGFRYAAKEKKAGQLCLFGVLDSVIAVVAMLMMAAHIAEVATDSCEAYCGNTIATLVVQGVLCIVLAVTAVGTWRLKGKVEALEVQTPVAASVVGSPALAQPKAESSGDVPSAV